VAVGDALYYLQFSKRQVDLGFELLLNKFAIDYYEGTTRPKEYSSAVSVAGQNHLISMNEPLKHGGFTFYQASYEADDDGTPRMSVLSVNYDPGRPVKYAGSLMMVLGIISMFYFKPKYSGSNKWLKKGES
jgi:cytochrome c biogenesis protein ResB